LSTSDAALALHANRLLAALPPAECRQLLPELRVVPLRHRAVLHQPRHALPYVYFPIAGVISMLAVTADAGEIEVGLVGSEGMAGLPAFLGAKTAPMQYLVPVPGQALRLPSEFLRERAYAGGPLHRLLLRYTNVLFTELSQSVACNSLHTVAQRCSRWLLMTQLRAGADEFPLTHDFLATILGVRRASVSEVARALQESGLIRYARGRLAVLDHKGLAATACECFRNGQEEMERLDYLCE
jgi:CRP-like cAMP-binding protein